MRGNGREMKVYICLFTCAVTRAIHLEVVTDLTEENFLQAFRRFVSRRSLPYTMISDNASTYSAAANELNELFQSDSLKQTLNRQGVNWQFIPKRAPWFGGFWERLIGLTKNAVKRVLGRAFVSLSTLQTITTEIEAHLNNCPLTYVSSEIDDPEPLTPAHLLYGRRIITLPHAQFEDEEIDDPNYRDTYTSQKELTKRAKIQAQLLDHFWSRWKHDYLTSLREFHKAAGVNTQEIKVGDVVIVHNEGPRSTWRLAVVKALHRGHDGLVRAADIRTSTGETSRPIAKLYPLEVSEGEQTSTCKAAVEDLTDSCEPVPSSRRARRAAVKARQRMSEWFKELGPPGSVEKM